mgnify:CR=1 FL=1
MSLPNLKVRYNRIYADDKNRLESIVDLKQQGNEVLYVIRKMKTTGKYYLAKTRWSPVHKTFVVDITKGDFTSFSKNLSHIMSQIPSEGVF